MRTAEGERAMIALGEDQGERPGRRGVQRLAGERGERLGVALHPSDRLGEQVAELLIVQVEDRRGEALVRVLDFGSNSCERPCERVLSVGGQREARTVDARLSSR